MKPEELAVVRGSGKVFRDLGHKNADAEQFKATRTGIAAADFSRIRSADLGRFTLDRLMSISNLLGARMEIKIRVRRHKAA